MSAQTSNIEVSAETQVQPPTPLDPRPTRLWAFTPIDYGPVQLGTLEDAIGSDDIVRLFAELLDQCDWSAWEAEYPGKRGRPPIHPRIPAGVILFGIFRGIRSSRRLEEACEYRLDFRWLARGLRPDHSTFSEFRRRFKEPLKDLFRQINGIAMSAGLISLCQIAYDATRVKAYNSRYKTYTKEKIEAKLKELDEQFEEAMAKFDQEDADSDGGGSPTKLPKHLASLEDRRSELQEEKNVSRN